MYFVRGGFHCAHTREQAAWLLQASAWFHKHDHVYKQGFPKKEILTGLQLIKVAQTFYFDNHNNIIMAEVGMAVQKSS